jgi:hypothetical protein
MEALNGLFGDPLSPLLAVLTMEALNGLFHLADARNLFTPLHVVVSSIPETKIETLILFDLFIHPFTSIHMRRGVRQHTDVAVQRGCAWQRAGAAVVGFMLKSSDHTYVL